LSTAVAERVLTLAKREENVKVLAQLTCSAKRLPANQALPLIHYLLEHGEDVSEKRVPLLIWWALEAHCAADRQAILDLFKDSAVWRLAVTETHILQRLMQRYALSGTRQDLVTCAQLLRMAPGPDQTARLMAGFESAFKGRSLSTMPDELAEAIAKAGGESV